MKQEITFWEASIGKHKEWKGISFGEIDGIYKMGSKMKKRTPKKKTGHKVLIVFVSILVFLIAVVGAVAAFAKYYTPSLDTDGPSFIVDTVDPGTVDPVSDDTESSDNPEYVRDTKIVNFLVMGRDKKAWNTDVIMLVNFNMRNGSLNILQIPRDTYIDLNGVRGRINTAMKTMRTLAYREDPSLSQAELLDKGMKGAAALLEESLCIKIDGYAIVNLEGFRNVVNAIGGVYMNVPADMHYEDPDQDLYIHLKKGPQLLNGEKAEMFVRFRSGYLEADIGRIDAQKIFLTALFNQLKNNINISTVTEIVNQLVKYVSTDISIPDLVFYAKELLGVDLSGISMMTMPGEAVQTGKTHGAWYYVINRKDSYNLINEYFNVYNKDIPDEAFDMNCAFTAEDLEHFNNIYYKEPEGITVDKGNDISSGSLDNIPRT